LQAPIIDQLVVYYNIFKVFAKLNKFLKYNRLFSAWARKYS